MNLPGIARKARPLRILRKQGKRQYAPMKRPMGRGTLEMFLSNGKASSATTNSNALPTQYIMNVRTNQADQMPAIHIWPASLRIAQRSFDHGTQNGPLKINELMDAMMMIKHRDRAPDKRAEARPPHTQY